MSAGRTRRRGKSRGSLKDLENLRQIRKIRGAAISEARREHSRWRIAGEKGTGGAGREQVWWGEGTTAENWFRFLKTLY